MAKKIFPPLSNLERQWIRNRVDILVHDQGVDRADAYRIAYKENYRRNKQSFAPKVVPLTREHKARATRAENKPFGLVEPSTIAQRNLREAARRKNLEL